MAHKPIDPDNYSQQEHGLNSLGMARAQRELLIMRLLERNGAMDYQAIKNAASAECRTKLTDNQVRSVLQGLVKDELVGYIAEGVRRRYYLRGV